VTTTTDARPGTAALARAVLPVGLLGTVVAVAATEAGAAAARAAGVTFLVDGRAVPAGAFGFWTLVGGVLGLVVALALRERRRFVRFGVAGTVLSFVPAVVMPDAATTSVVLVLLHVVAAVSVVGAVTSRLPAR
jgi:hypothetical protein